MAWVAAGSLYSFPAFAQEPPPVPGNILRLNNILGYDIDQANYPGTIGNANYCPFDWSFPDRQTIGLVKRIVLCVQGTVIPATYKMLWQTSLYFVAGPVAAACTLAIVLWGILLLTGKQSATMRDAFTLALKIGAVAFFTFALGTSEMFPYGLFPLMIQVIDHMAGIVTMYIGYSSSLDCAAALNPADVWGRVDCALDSLIGGIFSPVNLAAGALGFFFAALFSGPFGLFIGLLGFAIIFLMIFALMRATYIAITAYIAIAFMALVSPIFITMVLFSATRSYFEKWVKLTIGFMLQPIFLFAYISMMIAAFDVVVYDGPFSVYRALVGSRVDQSGETFGAFEWARQQYSAEKNTVNLGISADPRLQDAPGSEDTGTLGDTGAEELPDYVESHYKNRNIYSLDIPIKTIYWDGMAIEKICSSKPKPCDRGTVYDEIKRRICGADMICDDAQQAEYEKEIAMLPVEHLIYLLLALLIAMLTMYIFYIMLDVLPFIGAGITGEQYSMPVLGERGLKMAGGQMIDKLKGGMTKLATGGGG